MNKMVIIGALLLLLTACKQSQRARLPLSASGGTFMKESVIRNKKLIAGEERLIDSVIKSQPQLRYFASQKGYWYCYQQRNTSDTLRPRKGDIAYFNYEIKDFDGNVVYSEVELRPQVYRVDKQNIIPGLRHGLKLMHKNETVTFLFPSHLAYGYHGDNKRIGVNEPLMCTVTLNDFKPETNLVEPQ